MLGITTPRTPRPPVDATLATLENASSPVSPTLTPNISLARSPTASFARTRKTAATVNVPAKHGVKGKLKRTAGVTG